MNSITKSLAAAAVGAVGVLTFMNVASAADDTTTTTTPAVEAPADTSGADAAADDHNCPERDGSGAPSGADSSDGTDSTGSNVGFRWL